MKRAIFSIFNVLWGIYALIVFLVVALSATALMVMLPGLERRRRLVRSASRLIFRCCGVPLSVRSYCQSSRIPAFNPSLMRFRSLPSWILLLSMAIRIS